MVLVLVQLSQRTATLPSSFWTVWDLILVLLHVLYYYFNSGLAKSETCWCHLFHDNIYCLNLYVYIYET